MDSAKERITQAAYELACDEAQDFLESRYSGDYFVQALCTASAVESTDTAQACTASLDRCLNMPPAAIAEGIESILSRAGCNLLVVDTSTCSSTLGEIKACLDAIDQEVSELKYTLTCTAAGQKMAGWDNLELPAACLIQPDC